MEESSSSDLSRSSSTIDKRGSKESHHKVQNSEGVLSESGLGSFVVTETTTDVAGGGQSSSGFMTDQESSMQVSIS